ncbi:hypothetical protein PROFUN_14956 [Planoprotostelium fungivorum]|uniref:Uncharacterized protein n=1 Tax=Planoprotostelium fungivorum TaxID=1890364 RepID=A0A2P6MY92_9EUKA|nr:hypothetical protein PROFUN_14956 [Planoprotostelium fungivorum]
MMEKCPTEELQLGIQIATILSYDVWRAGTELKEIYTQHQVDVPRALETDHVQKMARMIVEGLKSPKDVLEPILTVLDSFISIEKMSFLSMCLTEGVFKALSNVLYEESSFEIVIQSITILSRAAERAPQAKIEIGSWLMEDILQWMKKQMTILNLPPPVLRTAAELLVVLLCKCRENQKILFHEWCEIAAERLNDICWMITKANHYPYQQLLIEALWRATVSAPDREKFMEVGFGGDVWKVFTKIEGGRLQEGIQDVARMINSTNPDTKVGELQLMERMFQKITFQADKGGLSFCLENSLVVFQYSKLRIMKEDKKTTTTQLYHTGPFDVILKDGAEDQRTLKLIFSDKENYDVSDSTLQFTDINQMFITNVLKRADLKPGIIGMYQIPRLSTRSNFEHTITRQGQTEDGEGVFRVTCNPLQKRLPEAIGTSERREENKDANLSDRRGEVKDVEGERSCSDRPREDKSQGTKRKLDETSEVAKNYMDDFIFTGTEDRRGRV